MIKKLSQGFTFLEILLYLGIVTLVTIPSLALISTFINDQNKEESVTEVSYRGTFVAYLLRETSRESQSISASTIYETNPGKLVFTLFDGTTVTVDTYTKQVLWGGVPTTIQKLRYKKGAEEALDMTSDDVHVSSFILRNLSRPASNLVEVQLEIQSLPLNTDQFYAAKRSWTFSLATGF